MATIKIILYKSKTYQDGTHPVLLQVTHKRKVKRISIGLSCSINHWNENRSRVRSSHPNHEAANNLISKELATAENVRLELIGKKREFTVDDLIIKIKGGESGISFTKYTQKLISGLIKSRKFGNASNYQCALNAIKNFAKKEDVLFSDIDNNFLTNMEVQHLANDNTLNGLSVYLRAVRAIFNKAIKAELIPPEQYPFRKYSIQQEGTKKRAITKDDLKKIISLDLIDETPIFHARNMFLFSFFTIGMSWVDMAHLKLTDIKSNRLEYKRAKTGKNFSVLINENIKNILDYYARGKQKNDYIFSIIERTSDKDIIKDIKNNLKNYNKRLKEIGEMVGVSEKLTSYVARHTWASIANFSDTPIGIISQGLGHKDIKTTQIYLAEFDHSDIDDANANIL